MLYIFSLLKNSGNNKLYLDSETIDLFISVTVFTLLPIVIFIVRKRIKILKMKISFSSLVIMLLLFGLLFAPIITNYNPNFQKNIRVTNFLPPLSSVKIVHLISTDKEQNKFLLKKTNTVKYSVDNSMQFFDSLQSKNELFEIFQKGKKSELLKNEVELLNGVPKITNKLFLFGTDELGRDIFTRIIYGARVSLIIAFFTVIIALLIGIGFGFFAAHYGGVIDLILSRITDAFLTIPAIFFIIMILAFWGNSLYSVVLVLAFSGWMSLFKVVRTEIVSLKQKDYYVASKLLGIPLYKLVINDIVPVIIGPVFVNIIFLFSNVILAEASLSYLGLGAGLNYPSWGNMILSGQNYMANGAWQILYPALVLIITILAINDFGEKLKKEITVLD